MKIALVQTNIIWEDERVNLNKLTQQLRTISSDAEVVILPEMFATGFTMAVQNLVKPAGKNIFAWMQNMAVSLQKVIVGSVLTEVNNRYYNRMYWVRPDGTFDYYDKRHLFHQGGEDAVMYAGHQNTIVTYKGVRFMLQICYDLRFPVAVKNKYNKEKQSYDYDVIIYIANWPEVRKQAYTSLLQARAIENQALVIWVNRVGEDNRNIAHSGDSKFVDAYGNIVTQAHPNTEDVLYIDLDINALNTFREQFKVGLDWDDFELL